MKILVTGGTGHLGREFVREARDAGHAIRILSRRPPPPGSAMDWTQADLGSARALENALHGTDAIVHLASDPGNSATVDVDGTRQLVEAARTVGTSHLVFVSIIGVDRISPSRTDSPRNRA